MLNQLKIQNIKNILLCLLAERKATKQSLGQKTGISNTTVSDAINSMLRLGFVVESGSMDSIGGRRSTIYTLNHEYGQFVGIALRAGVSDIVISDACGELLAWQTVRGATGESDVQLLYRAIETAQRMPVVKKPLAIGIGLDASIDYVNQIVLESRELSWQNVHLKELVERRFFVPCFIDSAVNGQIALHRYLLQEDCPQDIMILCEDFPKKLAICMEGKICRGTRNLCGSIEGFERVLDVVLPLAKTYDVSRLIITYRSARYDSRLMELSRQKSPVRVAIHKARPEEMALGMAVTAEIRWFESIYFLLQ